MKTKTKNGIKQLYLFILLMIMGMNVPAQENGYLMNRIKPGDILYRDGDHQEHFVDYRQWDQDDPPGIALGVVCYSYYGTVPCGVEGAEPGWHGWVVETGEKDSCAWAPENTICYDSCVAKYPVEGVYTRYNPTSDPVTYGNSDTCGWQNTKRLLEFIYTGCGSELSDAVSPALMYIFAEKNGVTDFTEKPVMRGDSWYLLSFGQLRVLYGMLGCVNTAMAACGGLLFSEGSWHSSSEIGNNYKNANWTVAYHGAAFNTTNWQKSLKRKVRAVRSF